MVWGVVYTIDPAYAVEVKANLGSNNPFLPILSEALNLPIGRLSGKGSNEHPRALHGQAFQFWMKLDIY